MVRSKKGDSRRRLLRWAQSGKLDDSLENSRKLLGEKRGHLLVFAPLLALRKLGGVPFFPFGWWSGHFHSSG